MNTRIKSRNELVDEKTLALQQRFNGFDAFNYIDIANNAISM